SRISQCRARSRSEPRLEQVNCFSLLFCSWANKGTPAADTARPMQAALVNTDFMKPPWRTESYGAPRRGARVSPSDLIPPQPEKVTGKSRLFPTKHFGRQRRTDSKYNHQGR